MACGDVEGQHADVAADRSEEHGDGGHGFNAARYESACRTGDNKVSDDEQYAHCGGCCDNYCSDRTVE